MGINEEFVSLWGKVLIELKEQGKKAIYAEAIGIKNGEITDSEVVAYIKTKENLLFKEQNLETIRGILRFILLKDVGFSLKVFDEERERVIRLKKMFGDKLEII